MGFEWSARQKEVYRDVLYSENRVHLLEGAVGSSKSTIAGHAVGDISLNFANGKVGIMGWDKENVMSDMFPILHQWAAKREIPYRRRTSNKVTRHYFGNNEFVPLSGNNKSRRNKLSGKNLAAMWVDECVLMNELVIEETFNRCRSIPHAKLIFTTNPEGDKHWFFRDYRQRAKEVGMTIHTLLQDDNPGLTEEFKQSTEMGTIGGYNLRRKHGIWASMTGRVFTGIPEPVARPSDLEVKQRCISVDPAVAGTTHALLIEVDTEGIHWVTGEWRWDARLEGRQIGFDEQARLIQRKLGVPDYLICDSASAAMLLSLSEVFSRPCFKSYKQKSGMVLPGIERTTRLLATGQIKVTTGVPHLIDEMKYYEWDENAAEQGEEKPLKYRDHGCDALRYYVTTGYSGRY